MPASTAILFGHEMDATDCTSVVIEGTPRNASNVLQS